MTTFLAFASGCRVRLGDRPETLIFCETTGCEFTVDLQRMTCTCDSRDCLHLLAIEDVARAQRVDAAEQRKLHLPPQCWYGEKSEAYLRASADFGYADACCRRLQDWDFWNQCNPFYKAPTKKASPKPILSLSDAKAAILQGDW